MGLFFSPSAGGFFDTTIHGFMVPVDAISITTEEHQRLLAAQAEGKRICADAQGRPQAVAEPAPDLAALRSRAIRLARTAARRRILAIAPLERQSNDNADIALQALQIAQAGHTTIDTAAAIDRRARIDLVRAASNQLEAAIAGMNARALAQLDPAAPSHWPN